MTRTLDTHTKLSPDEAHARVQELALSSSAHPAVTNPFYELWMREALSPAQVRLVAWNFFSRVRRTPDRIALAFLHMNDITARAETVENLSDEMGHGDPAKAHTVLLGSFFGELLHRLSGERIDFATHHEPLLPSTVRLIEEGEKVFSSPYPAEACGALLAQEWHAYPQLVQLYEGVRNYRHLFELTEFHEWCEYFYLHIGATEKEHKVHSLRTAAGLCATEADFAHLEQGFNTYLGLLADNWSDIHSALRNA